MFKGILITVAKKNKQKRIINTVSVENSFRNLSFKSIDNLFLLTDISYQ